MRRQFLRFGLLLTGCGLSPTACTAPDAGPASSTREAGSTITLLTTGDERIWNPAASMPAQQLVFLPLFHDDGSGPEGRLVRSWEESENGATWTYHLRTDVRWHDGVPVTAHDIKFTVDLLSRPPEVPFIDPSALDVEVVDDSTVVFEYHAPARLVPLDTWFVFYPKHLLGALDPKEFNEWEFWERPVGNGPYRYVRHVPQTMVELEANSDHYRGRPTIDRVILKFGGLTYTELMSGNVDVADMSAISPTEWTKLASRPELVGYSSVWRSAYAVFWNHDHPVVGDPAVRKALSLAVDRRALHGLLQLPPEVPMLDLLVSMRQLRTNDFPPARAYDPEGARRILEEAGWHDADGDGIRERDGIELAFTMLSRRDARIAVFLQDRWRRVGARVEVQPLGPDLAVPRFRSGEFEATMSGSPRNMEPSLRVIACGDVSDCSRGQPPRPTGYWAPELNRIVERMDAAIDPRAGEDAYRAAWPILRRDEPVTVLAPIILTTISHRRVRGLSSPYKLMPEIHMDELWIEEDWEDTAGQDSVQRVATGQ